MGRLGAFTTFLNKYIKGIPINIEYRYPQDLNNKTTKVLTDEVNFSPVRPDNKFDFEEYSNAVVSIIHGSEPRFSVGIYGEWGSGKTTLMEMIRRKLTPEKFRWEDIPDNQSKSDMLRQYLKSSFKIDWINAHRFNKSKDATSIYLNDTHNQKHLSINLNLHKMTAKLMIDYRPVYEFLVKETNNGLAIYENSILTVWFNAWRYENEKDFALIPLMKTIAYTIGDHPVFKDIKPLILRALVILGKDALRFYALKYFMTEKGIEEFETNLKNKFEDSEEFDREALYFEGIKKIEQKMLEILDNPIHRNSRIVIFVDDLDRCSPEKTLEVFESIKVFLDIKGFIFILGLSREALDKLIVAKFEKIGLKGISGEQYIRKIIQIEIQIAKWKNDSIGNLIDNISRGLDNNYRDVVGKNKQLIEQVVESNPRQAKRFINNLIIALTANPHLDYYTFLVVEALQKRWKYFYNNLSNTAFLKEIKSGIGKSRDERLRRISEMEGKKSRSELSYDISNKFDDLRYCYLDDDLWTFLNKFGDPILSEFLPSEQPTTEAEVAASKKFEGYQQASESSNIPIPITANQIPADEKRYAQSYYIPIIRRMEDYRYLIKNIEQSGADALEEAASRPIRIQRKEPAMGAIMEDTMRIGESPSASLQTSAPATPPPGDNAINSSLELYERIKSFVTLYSYKREPKLRDKDEGISNMLSGLLSANEQMYERLSNIKEFVSTEELLSLLPHIRNIDTLVLKIWAKSKSIVDEFGFIVQVAPTSPTPASGL